VTDDVLILMSFLSKDLNRAIMKSLLRGRKDIRALCRDIHRKRSTVFDSLKEMENIGVIQSKKVRTPGRGRNKKEYSIKRFYIPEITRETLFDFLEGKDVRSKSMDLGDMILIGSLSRISPIPPEKIFDLLLSSGVDFKYVLQILIDLASELQIDTDKPDTIEKKSEENTKAAASIYERIVEIIKNRYPIRNEVIQRFIEISKGKIVLTSDSGTKTMLTSDLISVAVRELEITDYEAEYMVPSVLHMLKSNGFTEISYAMIVDLIYLMAKNMKIDCRKPKFYVEGPVVRDFRKFAAITIRDGSVRRKWNAPHIADFLSKRFEIDKESSSFLANLILDRLKFISLESYDISFVESLARELVVEHGL
jgi:predicted transcriptional regulator